MPIVTLGKRTENFWIKYRNFNFDDLLRQFAAIRAMGPIEELLKSVPGIEAAGLEGATDRDFLRVEAILRAMTREERRNPDLLDAPRLFRIANGSGTSLRAVSDVITQFAILRGVIEDQR